MKLLALVAALIAVSVPASARFLAADFEDLPPGPLSSQPGWGDSSAVIPIIFSAMVTNAQPLYGHQCAELPAASTSLLAVMGSRLANTNFVAQPAAGEGAVLRASAWIHRDNRNDRMSIILGYTGRNVLHLYESVPGGTLIYSNAASGGHHDTGRLMATGRYSQVVFHYDTASSDCSVDYDGETLIDDTLAFGPALTNFNRFSIFRSTYTGTPGRVFVDEMRLDAFPSYVAAWWRFDEFDPAYADDAVGNFFTSRMGFEWPVRDAPADDQVWAGGRDVADRCSQQAHVHTNVDVWKSVNLGTNWTVEALVRLRPNRQNYDLVNLGQRLSGGGATTNSLIAVRLVGYTNFMTLNADLRDADDPLITSDFEPELGQIPCDDQWHHLALVKTSATLRAYVDYQLSASNALGSRTDGAYRFPIFKAEASVGCMLVGGNQATTNHWADEIRVSSAALAPSQFLHRSTPGVVQLAPSVLAPDTWALWFEAPPGTSNSLQVASQLEPANWKQTGWLAATGHVTVGIAPAAGPTNLLRVMRRLQP